MSTLTNSPYEKLENILDSRIEWFEEESHRYDYYKKYARTPHTYEAKDLETFPGRRKYVPRILLHDIISIYHMALLEMAYAVSEDFADTHILLNKIDCIWQYMHGPFVETQVDMGNFIPKEGK